MRFFLVLVCAAGLGCGGSLSALSGVYAGTGTINAMAQGCPDVPWDFAVTVDYSVSESGALVIAEVGSITGTMTGTVSRDGWFYADREFVIDDNTWGFKAADGRLEADVVHHSEMFDGLVGGSVCWSVATATLRRR